MLIDVGGLLQERKGLNMEDDGLKKLSLPDKCDRALEISASSCFRKPAASFHALPSMEPSNVIRQVHECTTVESTKYLTEDISTEGGRYNSEGRNSAHQMIAESKSTHMQTHTTSCADSSG
jgi:hypothetical protein